MRSLTLCFWHAPERLGVTISCVTAQVKDAFGTVRYSSPEMAADTGIGQKTDVWSAGALMYFMLSGRAPFLKKDDVHTLDYIKKKPKVWLCGCLIISVVTDSHLVTNI